MRNPNLILLVILFVAGAAHGAETPISTPPLGPTAAGVGSADVVPLGDGFLAIWTEGSQCGAQELRGIRLDRDGHLRDVRSFVVAPGHYGTSIIATAPDGDEAYVAWRSSGNAVHLTRVDADVTVTTLSDSVPLLGATVMRASNGNILFLGPVKFQGDPLTVTLVDRTGAVVRSGVPVVEPGAIFGTDLVAANGTFLLGWIGADRRVRITSVSPVDVAANNVPIMPFVGVTGGSAYSIRLASNGAHSMAFWFEANVHELRARSLTSSGTPLGAGPVTIGSFEPVGPPAAVVVSDGYEVVFREVANGISQVVSLRVSFDGTLRSVSRSAAIPGLYSVAAAQNGDRAIAVWNEHRDGTSNYEAGLRAVAVPIAADGSIGASTILSLDLPVQHVRKLVPFAGGAAALWTESAPNDRVVVGRLRPSGKPVDGPGLRLRESIYDQGHSAIATDGERLFVVWTEGELYKPQALYGAVVPLSGALSSSVRQLASDAVSDSDITVAWNGETFTIVYRRAGTNVGDFAALRADRFGNVVDPSPIVLMPARWGDENPRLSWNGSDYLLVWQRAYDPFMYLPEPIPCAQPQPLPAELFAQRLSAALVPSGAEIDLATTTNYNTVLRDAEGADVSFAGGLWLVSWVDKAVGSAAYARIDASGTRLDPLNGRLLSWSFWSFDAPFLAATPDGWTVAAHEGSGPYGEGRGVALARIGLNGVPSFLGTVPLPGINAVEAFALTPLPVVAYKRFSSSAAYIATLPQHARAVQH